MFFSQPLAQIEPKFIPFIIIFRSYGTPLHFVIIHFPGLKSVATT